MVFRAETFAAFVFQIWVAQPELQKVAPFGNFTLSWFNGSGSLPLINVKNSSLPSAELRQASTKSDFIFEQTEAQDDDTITALPIELTHFSAKFNGSSVTLNWNTASEINNDYFSVLRSGNGLNFEEINTIKGAGNSLVSLNYTVSDAAPLKGKLLL